MTQDQATRIVSRHETLVVLSTYNILFTNDIVCAFLIDAAAQLEKSPLCRQETKRLLNQSKSARREYERVVNRVIADRSAFFADANDIFAEEVERHVEVLYYCIKREFDRNKLPHSDITARMETARTLCDFACRQFDKRMEELRGKDPRFRSFHLSYLRLTNLLRLLDELMRTFRIPPAVDLNTPECLAAIDVLARKLLDGELIAKAISA